MFRKFLFLLILLPGVLTVAVPAQQKCTDPVKEVVWHSVKSIVSGGDWDCRNVLSSRRLSFGNRTGFIVSGIGMPLCGATGNCSTWVVGLLGKRYQVLIDAGSVIENVDVLKGRAGHPDLVFRGRMGAGEFYRGTFTFRRGKYSLSNCVHEYNGVRPGKLTLSKAPLAYCSTGN